MKDSKQTLPTTTETFSESLSQMTWDGSPHNHEWRACGDEVEFRGSQAQPMTCKKCNKMGWMIWHEVTP